MTPPPLGRCEPLGHGVCNEDLTVFATRSADLNPYAAIIYDEVRRRGTTVIDVASWRPRELLARAVGPRRILHLQWFNASAQGAPSPLRSMVRSSRDLLNLTRLRLHGVGIVWTLHDDPIRWSGHPQLGNVMQRLLVCLVANQTVVLTPAARETVRARYGARAARRVRVVPHPTYLGVYGGAPTMAEARRALGVPLGAQVLVCFGSIKPYKGVPDLLEVFAGLPGADLLLMIAGRPISADLQHDLEQAAATDPRVRLRLDRVPEHEVAPLIAAADVVVLPYQNVQNSGVLYLAMTYDRPVVAPRMGVFAELAAIDELPGLVYDPGALGDALSAALCASSEERARWSQVMERHRAVGRPDVVADALLATYREAAS